MTTEPSRQIKCVVWDLDDTVWEGTLAEGGAGRLRDGIAEFLATLDSRGILHSIASKNSAGHALARLRELGVADYFVSPQISWRPKSDLLKEIAGALNIALDSLIFIDDSPFERAEVEFTHPMVRCVDADHLDDLLQWPEFDIPVTAEGRDRRMMYRQAEARSSYEASFAGPRSDFLASLQMRRPLGHRDQERPRARR